MTYSGGRNIRNHLVFFIIFFLSINTAYSASRSQPFSPGQTLDPGAESVGACGPTDTNCFVSTGAIYDEGVLSTTSPMVIDFVGSGVTVTSSGATTTVSISSSGVSGTQGQTTTFDSGGNQVATSSLTFNTARTATFVSGVNAASTTITATSTTQGLFASFGNIVSSVISNLVATIANITNATIATLTNTTATIYNATIGTLTATSTVNIYQTANIATLNATSSLTSNMRTDLASTTAYGRFIAGYVVATSTTATSTFVGAVGIGTTTPESQLQIRGDGRGNVFGSPALVRISTNDSSSWPLVLENLSTGTSSAVSFFVDGDSNGGALHFMIGDGHGGNTNPLTVDGDGVFFGKNGPIENMITFEGSNSVGVISENNDVYWLGSATNRSASPTRVLNWNGSGNVGLGSTTPFAKLSVKGAGASTGLAFAITDSSNVLKLQIQDNGRLSIGTTSANYAAEIASGGTGALRLSAPVGTDNVFTFNSRGVDNFSIRGTNGSDAYLNGVNSSTLFLGASPSGAGAIVNMMSLAPSGSIVVGAGGTNGLLSIASTTMSGSGVVLSVGTSTAGNILTVQANGYVGIGQTPSYKLDVIDSRANDFIARFANVNNTAGAQGVVVQAGSNTLNNSYIMRFLRPDTTEIGKIVQDTTTSVSYTTTSDLREKENVTTTTYGLSDLMNIQVADFNFRNDASQKKITGFIAQDLYLVFPDAVVTNGDDGLVPLNASSSPWSVDYGRVTPLLAKSIQDLSGVVFGTTTDALSLATSTFPNGLAPTVASLASTTATITDAFGGETFLGQVLSNIYVHLIAWFSDTKNGIVKFFAGSVETKELCISDESGNKTCITKEKLDKMIKGTAENSNTENILSSQTQLPDSLVSTTTTNSTSITNATSENPVASTSATEAPSSSSSSSNNIQVDSGASAIPDPVVPDTSAPVVQVTIVTP